MNHNKDFSHFQKYLDLLLFKGYKPIAVSQIYMEDTYVFETAEEAKQAYNEFERSIEGKWIGEIMGWWYGKETFLEAVKDYEEEYKEELSIYWL